MFQHFEVVLKTRMHRNQYVWDENMKEWVAHYGSFVHFNFFLQKMKFYASVSQVLFTTMFIFVYLVSVILPITDLKRNFQKSSLNNCISFTCGTTLSWLSNWTKASFLDVSGLRLSFHEALSSIQAAVEVAESVDLENTIAVTFLLDHQVFRRCRSF